MKKKRYKSAEILQPEKKRTFLDVLIEIGLLLSSSLVFALSFPSFLSNWGWGPLAFISVIPVFIVVHRCSWKVVVPYGIIYGFITYAIFNYWLSTFHALAIFIVPTIYAVYFIIFMPILKLADRLFPKYGYLVQILLWISYEYLRTQGFLGYPYGNIGYSQYLFLPFIQIASVTGVWGVSALVIFPSAYLGHALKKGVKSFKVFWKNHKIDVFVYAGVLVLVMIFGIFSKYDYSESPTWKAALVQHNSNTWKGGQFQYKKNFDLLKEITELALAEDDSVDIVIWSETAFVPGVAWHSRYNTDADRRNLVKEFVNFASSLPVPLLTGNSHGEAIGYGPGQTPREGIVTEPEYYRSNGKERVNYNAVLLYTGSKEPEVYRKTHLVPFTEYFPYKDTLPGLYKILKNNDYHFWEKGIEKDKTHVFDNKGVKFSTPICYEDVFGYLNRKFVRSGAQVIVNMTNDKWSGAESAQMQHLAMAVFRAVENKRSMFRGSNSGMTVSIEPDGEITNMLEPFTSDYMIAEVPVYDDMETVYTKLGNWFPFLTFLAVFGIFIFGILRFFIKKQNQQ